MKTIEIIPGPTVEPQQLVKRVSDNVAFDLVAQGKAKYIPKSKWKTIRDARKEIEDRKAKELKARQASEVNAKPEQKKDHKHFKKGKSHGNFTGKGQVGQNSQGKQRVQGEDRKAG